MSARRLTRARFQASFYERIARKLPAATTESATLVAFGQQVSVQSAVLDGFGIGALAVIGPGPAGVGNLSYWQGVRIDAIVGLDVLARTNLRIDYKTRRLSFGPVGREDS